MAPSRSTDRPIAEPGITNGPKAHTLERANGVRFACDGIAFLTWIARAANEAWARRVGDQLMITFGSTIARPAYT